MKGTLYKGKQHAVGSFYSKCSLSWDYCFSAAAPKCRVPFRSPAVITFLVLLSYRTFFHGLAKLSVWGKQVESKSKKSSYSCGEFNKANVKGTVKTFQHM